MPDARKHIRRMVNFPAKIDTGSPALHDCMLMDVSSTGARLAAEQIAGLPADFTVVLSYRGVPRRRCHVVWRSTAEVGVRFEDDKTLKKSKVRENRNAAIEDTATAEKR